MKRLDNIDNLHKHRSTEHNASTGVWLGYCLSYPFL
jgi:hypothetical protein